MKKYYYELSDRGDVFDDMISIIPSRNIFSESYFEILVNMGKDYSVEFMLALINFPRVMEEFSDTLFRNGGNSFSHKNFSIKFFVKGDVNPFFVYRSLNG